MLKGLGRKHNVRESDKIHVDYDNSARDGSCTIGECFDQGGHVCCCDVWGGCMKDRSLDPTLRDRDCTEEETFKLDFFRVFMKQLVSGVLFALVSWYIFITANQRESKEGQNVTFPMLFDCDPDSPTSIIFVDELEDDFDDGGVQFCYFKSAMTVISFLLLFPLLIETISILTIIWVSSINPGVLVPIVDGKYVGSDDILDNLFKDRVPKRIIECFFVLYSVPKEILKINKELEKPVSRLLLLVEMLWKLIVLMLPDVLLTGSLFFVSYFVMISSDNPEDVIVNLVAVQIFAELDDIFVRTLFTPRVNCGKKLSTYVVENSFGKRPIYRPFQAYIATEQRHQMGIKVPKNDRMFYYHDYTGHHLINK